MKIVGWRAFPVTSIDRSLGIQVSIQETARNIFSTAIFKDAIDDSILLLILAVSCSIKIEIDTCYFTSMKVFIHCVL